MSKTSTEEIPFPHGDHEAGYLNPTPDAAIQAWLLANAALPCANCDQPAWFIMKVSEKGRPVYTCNNPECIGLGVLEAQNTPQGILSSVEVSDIWQPTAMPVWTPEMNERITSVGKISKGRTIWREVKQ